MHFVLLQCEHVASEHVNLIWDVELIYFDSGGRRLRVSHRNESLVVVVGC